MLERLLAFIQKHRLLDPGETVAVGYSGGPDSTCLLALLVEAGYRVVAAHLNHAQRPEAEEEQTNCKITARNLGAEFVAKRADVPALAAAHRIGVEEAGRQARYRFFAEVSERRGGIKVATGHTLDDHVETIFLNLARGSGMTGLAGIPIRRGHIIRPLLWARRLETGAFCAERGLWTHDDPANLDPAFARARARLSLLPAFESLHPDAMSNAARSALILAEEDALLDAYAAESLKAARRTPSTPLGFLVERHEARFNAGALSLLSLPLLRRAVRLAAEPLGGSLTFEQTQLIAQAIVQKRKASVTTEGNEAIVEARPGTLLVQLAQSPPTFRHALQVPGEVVCEAGGWRMRCKETEGDCMREPGSLDVVVDLDALQGGLELRPFAPGERIGPLGAGYERKIQDVLTDAKLGASLKARLPILFDAEGAVWVPGVCIADRVKVTPATKRRLSLEFGRV